MTDKQRFITNAKNAGCDVTINDNEVSWYTLNGEYLIKNLFDDNGNIIHHMTIDLQTNKAVSQW